MLTTTDGTDDVRTARLLVANNAIVDERNAECFTALMLAVRSTCLRAGVHNMSVCVSDDIVSIEELYVDQ